MWCREEIPGQRRPENRRAQGGDGEDDNASARDPPIELTAQPLHGEEQGEDQYEQEKIVVVDAEQRRPDQSQHDGVPTTQTRPGQPVDGFQPPGDHGQLHQPAVALVQVRHDQRYSRDERGVPGRHKAPPEQIGHQRYGEGDGDPAELEYVPRSHAGQGCGPAQQPEVPRGVVARKVAVGVVDDLPGVCETRDHRRTEGLVTLHAVHVERSAVQRGEHGQPGESREQGGQQVAVPRPTGPPSPPHRTYGQRSDDHGGGVQPVLRPPRPRMRAGSEREEVNPQHDETHQDSEEDRAGRPAPSPEPGPLMWCLILGPSRRQCGLRLARTRQHGIRPLGRVLHVDPSPPSLGQQRSGSAERQRSCARCQREQSRTPVRPGFR